MTEEEQILKPLEDFLQSNNAKLNVQIGPNFTHYTVNGHGILVYLHKERKKIAGWNIFLPASESTSTAEVLAATEKYVELTE